MNSLLNIIIAAKDGKGGWMELIIPVVIVIVYAIVGIAKAKSNLKKDQPSEEPEQQSPPPISPRYKPLDDSSHGWKHPNSRHAAPIQPTPPMPSREDKQIERQLAPKTAARKQPTTPKQRNTLESFLDTQAPKSLRTRAAEAQAKAKEKEKARRALALRAVQKRKVEKKPKPKFHRATPATKKPVSAAKKQPVTPEPTTLTELLKDHESIRTAIILKEILGKPVALRDY